jgi:nucleoid-associated protein YgaU
MGKETKIGLTVILVLLVGLGVVVANRLTAPDEDTLASQAKNEKVDKSKKGRTAKDGSVKVLPGAPGKAASKKMTVVTSRNTTTRPPKSSSSAMNRWSMAPGASAKKRGSATASDMVSRPSFMPKPATAVSAAPLPRYGSRGAGSLRPTTNPLFASDQTRQYTQGRTAPAPPRPVPAATVSQTAQRPLGGGYGHAKSGAYPSGRHATGGYSSGSSTTTYGGSQYGQRRTSTSGPAHQYSQYSTRPGNNAAGMSSSFGSQTRGENGEYEVQPNDSYWVISKKLYGSGSYFKALAEHNNRKYPRQDQLQIGDVIIAPSLSQLEQTYPDLVPEESHRNVQQSRTTAVNMVGQYSGGRTYVVEEGDTLSDIARYELGKSNRWVEIYELNRDRLGKDFDYLVPGISLILPNDAVGNGGTTSSGRGDTLTRRPGAVYRR